MKRFYFILLFLLSNAVKTHAQGIFQMWGMTRGGGTDNIGTIFSMSSAGNNFQKRYDFTLTNPGKTPLYTSLTEFNGKFYGVTSKGGFDDVGVIFEWDPLTNIYSKKMDFISANGSFPNGSLALYNNKFYGLTSKGGASDLGVVFEWNPVSNIYTKKIDLTVANGTSPDGSLTLNNGKFYGLTSAGGISGVGVIFEWNPLTNIFIKKIDLVSSTGGQPHGDLTFNAGKFYGLTSNGGVSNGGVIFEWDPTTNIYLKKIDLNSSNGNIPYGSLTINADKGYGMTMSGGLNGLGVIFEWDIQSNTYTKKIDFSVTEGGGPFGNLTLINGVYFGMTKFGGNIPSDSGVVFKWDPNTNIYEKKISFIGSGTGVSPQGSLTLSNGKLYGMTSYGGASDFSLGSSGTIFEFNPSTDLLTQKIKFNDGSLQGKIPRGSLISSGGKFYGMTSSGGIHNEGVIFEWNPTNATLLNRFNFSYSGGRNPYGNLTEYNGKLYGMTSGGGNNGAGVIFEWNPTTNIYTKKIDLTTINGSNPLGNLTYNAGKFYGMTFSGGINNKGVIFEWNPTTNLYTKKIDFGQSNGSNPAASLLFNSGKFYGTTSNGCGSNGCTGDGGTFFDWNSTTNVLTTKYSFYPGYDGIHPLGSFTLAFGKLYGMLSTQGIYGISGVGAVYEWDPVSNNLVFKSYFENTYGGPGNPKGSLTLSGAALYGLASTGGSNGKGAIFWASNSFNGVQKSFTGQDGGNPGSNDLTVFPAPVAKGTLNSCTNFPSITIDISNNNVWVPLVDNLGDAVAEIKANGNNLGVVNTSMYINAGPVREDAANKIYLDRNLTITPTVQPSTPVNIRLYLKGSEYEALKNATNSLGQPSGINSINDVGFFKNNEGCLPALQNTASPVVVTGEAWNGDYVLTATINSFSSFYAANKANTVLSLSLLKFNARLVKDNAVLNWKTANEINTNSFDVEKSLDGISFKKIGKVLSYNTAGVHDYIFTDENVTALNVSKIYYRLKQKDNDGKFSSSSIVVLLISKNKTVVIYPNPVSNIVTLTFSNNALLQTNAIITDMQGKQVKQFIIKNSQEKIDISIFPKGVYMLKLADGSVNKLFKN